VAATAARAGEITAALCHTVDVHRDTGVSRGGNIQAAAAGHAIATADCGKTGVAVSATSKQEKTARSVKRSRSSSHGEEA